MSLSSPRPRSPYYGVGLASRLLVTVPLAALILGAAVEAAPPEPLTFQLVDYGVNGDWRAGTPWVEVPSQADLNAQDPLFAAPVRPVTHLVITMPSDNDLASMSVSQMRQIMADQLRSQVDQGIQQGSSEFEIRLMQHMTMAGYSNRQDEVAQFGQIAYGALADAINSFKNNTSNIAVFGTFGSNGTVVFSKSVDAWQNLAPMIQRVTFVDGRAKVDDVLNMLHATADGAPVFPADRLRIFNTVHDAPAPPDSIANLFGSRSVQSQFHDVSVVLLDPENPWSRVSQHIASLQEGTVKFHATQYFSDGTHWTLGPMDRATLYPQFDARSAAAFNGSLPLVGTRPPAVPELRAVPDKTLAGGGDNLGGVSVDPKPVGSRAHLLELRAKVLDASHAGPGPAHDLPW